MSEAPSDRTGEYRGPFRAADGRLLRIDELPIPEDATAGLGWSPLMLEIADHIGPYATLKLLDALGGEHIRVSGTAAQRELLAAAIGAVKSTVFQNAFRGCKLDLPVARYAMLRAKGRPVLQAVAQRELKIADAARILGVGRTRVHDLLSELQRPAAERVTLYAEQRAEQ